MTDTARNAHSDACIASDTSAVAMPSPTSAPNTTGGQGLLRLPADELEAPLRIGDGGTVVNDVLLFRDFFMFMSSSLPGPDSLLSENGFLCKPLVWLTVVEDPRC
jgi:hypothetical protein